jgi:hypothetical protein
MSLNWAGLRCDLHPIGSPWLFFDGQDWLILDHMTTDLKTRTPSTLVHSDDLTRGIDTDLGPMLAD